MKWILALLIVLAIERAIVGTLLVTRDRPVYLIAPQQAGRVADPPDQPAGVLRPDGSIHWFD